MKKTFCDICEEDITHSKSYVTIKMNVTLADGLSKNSGSNSRMLEICHACCVKIGLRKYQCKTQINGMLDKLIEIMKTMS